MTRRFHSSLTLLVLLNLLFVQITGAVGSHWLIPLYALTGLAPRLVRYHGSRLYRTVWNLGVIAIFAILVTDAVTTGPTHLLEDGLTLAAFCQVHLLNVISRLSKADLLFFNSFLIALVTSFFSQDMAYSITFAAYAFVFVVALQLNTIVPAPDDSDRAFPAVMRDGLWRAFVTLIVTALAFMFWPRDFAREGLIQQQLLQMARSEVGFSEEVVLGRSAHTTVSDRVVMEVQPLRGEVPTHWRGATLTEFDARGWHSSRSLGSQLDERWRRREIEVWARRSDPLLGQARVQFYDPIVRRLFLPLAGTHLEARVGIDPDSIAPLRDGTIGYRGVNRISRDYPPLTYIVGWGSERGGADRSLPRLEFRDTKRLTQVDRSAVPDNVHDRLEEAAGDLGPGAAQTVVVERCRSYLEHRFDYLIPGEQGAANDLEEFMSGDAGGHCEYFATALAIMLRLRHIPCRMVTGFLVQEWDDENQILVVRAKHAHAWVEVWDPETGWYTVDGTPSSDLGDAGAEGISTWGAWLKTIEGWWRTVTRFDAEDRALILAWATGLPQRTFRALIDHPLRSLVLIVLTALAIRIWRRKRRVRCDPQVEAYERTLRRLGLRRTLAETPRELLDRARSLELRPEQLADLEAATSVHEATRYGARIRLSGRLS